MQQIYNFLPNKKTFLKSNFFSYLCKTDNV